MQILFAVSQVDFKYLLDIVLKYMCMCVCAQKYLTLCDPVNCSLPCSSVHEILQVRILERVAISSSRGSSGPRDQTCVS